MGPRRTSTQTWAVRLPPGVTSALRPQGWGRVGLTKGTQHRKRKAHTRRPWDERARNPWLAASSVKCFHEPRRLCASPDVPSTHCCGQFFHVLRCCHPLKCRRPWENQRPSARFLWEPVSRPFAESGVWDPRVPISPPGGGCFCQTHSLAEGEVRPERRLLSKKWYLPGWCVRLLCHTCTLTIHTLHWEDTSSTWRGSQQLPAAPKMPLTLFEGIDS